MTVFELYQALEARMPRSLSCEWDNDGLMLCADGKAEVKKVLFTLDVTDEAADYAIAEGFDLILSHHPMIFRPLRGITDPKHVKLLQNGISVMSFHTRLDAVEGGVNDMLASLFGLTDTARFTEEGIGVIGTLPQTFMSAELAALAKGRLGAPKVEAVLSCRPCRRLAVVGGDGKDFIEAAAKAGADAYLTGNMSYNSMTDGEALGITLIAAGHYETENPVLPSLARWVKEIAGEIETEIFACNRICVL